MRFCVIGDPIEHSKSPLMHQAAYRALGVHHEYERRHVRHDQLPAIVDALRRGELDGCNVTVPHKSAILGLCDQATPTARRAKAANTLRRGRDGAVIADNTDVPAMVAELRTQLGSRKAKRALVLGAGGAAKATLVALDALRIREVVVRTRGGDNDARRDELRAIAGPRLSLSLEELTKGADDDRFDVLVQATSLGLTGDGAKVRDAVDWSRVPKHALAIEWIYGDRPTPWLSAARARGLTASCGRGLLARQGALALEAWLGVVAPLYSMWQALG